MKFSFIVPVYNVEPYLKKCIESLLDQKDVALEIILVDDGSTDGSGHICDEYAREYDFVHVFHQLNEGLSSARNTGILHATGDYILFVDSDDEIEKDSLRRIQNEILRAECPDIVFLECKKVFYNEKNRVIKKSQWVMV